MKVLVTGGCGFIGSHIVDLLIEGGHEVSVVDNLATGKLSNLAAGIQVHHVDIRRPELRDLLAQEHPEVVIHQAAQVGVPVSVHDPIYDGEVNILGSIRLIDVCYQIGVRKVVYASSCAIYGDPPLCPVHESSPPSPVAPYGVSKLAVEFYLAAFQKLTGLSYTILRYANVYGPRQDPHGEGGVVSIFAEAVTQSRPVSIHGSGEQERDFIYVSDVAAANVQALDRADGQTLNIGTGQGTTINELLATLTELADYSRAPRQTAARTGDIFRMVLDSSQARGALNWSPTISLKDGLARTLAYFRAANSVA